MENKTVIVEKRVKSTVIRRRKKVVEPVPEVMKVDQVKVSSEAVAPKEVPADKQASVIVQEQQAPSKEEKAKKEKEAVSVKKEEKKIIPLVSKTILEEELDEKDKKLKSKKIQKKKERKIEIEGIGQVASIAQLTRIAHTDRVERVFQPSRTGRRKKIISRKGQKKTQITETKAIKRIIEMSQQISVGDLARAMGIKASEIIKYLMNSGTMVTVNQTIDFETATLVAHEYKFEVKDVSFNEQKIFENFEKGAAPQLEPRPPVVTVMGHVDHGKTSLLDAIRKTSVTEGEAGGITQHIGAYTVNLPKGRITFLDTPGHEAFTSMRARGASITDLVILVVAADDGIMPQTIESINHAQAAKVPLVVAINKIDKPDADIDRIKRQLSDKGLAPEEWGGDTLFTLVSAKQKKGIEDLLESVLLQAEVLELKADPHVMARGVVIEAKLDRSRGPVATVLVQQGTLKLGDYIVAGSYSGRIRAMIDHAGQHTDKAPPSYAVEIMGMDGVPLASELFHVTPDEKSGRMIAEHRYAEQKAKDLAPMSKISLEDFFAKSQTADVKDLKVILKCDVQGSLEAIQEALAKLSTEKVQVKLIHGAVGGINESDVMLASASDAIIIGFNVRPETKALSVAAKEGVDVKLYKIIYEMIEEIKLAMRGLLAPNKIETYLGRAEVRQAFTVSKVGVIAGTYIIDGRVTRTANLRLLRNNVVLYEGKVSSLKRFKDDVKEATQGFECGLGIEGYQDIKTGDIIEAFDIKLVQAEL